MIPSSKLTKPLAKEAIRMFSAFRVDVPEFVTQEFNKSSKPSIGENKLFLAPNTVKRIAEELSFDLTKAANKGDVKSQNLLTAINGFNTKKASALFLSNGPTVGRALTHFSDVISHLCGFCVQTGYRRDLVVDPDIQGRETLPPHTDGEYGSTPDMITLLGKNAPFGNYRTFIIKLQDVLDNLSDEAKQILQRPIFLQVGNGQQSLVPILHKCGANFTTRANYKFDLSDHPDLSKRDVEISIHAINTVLTTLYQQEKLESFYIKTGDSLYLLNQDDGKEEEEKESYFHGRDQIGVPYNLRDRVRIVLSGNYMRRIEPDLELSSSTTASQLSPTAKNEKDTTRS